MKITPSPRAPHVRRLAAAALLAGACSRATTATLTPPAPSTGDVVVERCWSCDTIPMEYALATAVGSRIDDLKRRGGECRAYGLVLEESFRNGRITMRPSMWRHGTRLVAGEARPNGEMTLAREIDSLNVGVRGIDDVVWTMEHEAAHIAFSIPSSSSVDEMSVDTFVHNCRSRLPR